MSEYLTIVRQLAEVISRVTEFSAATGDATGGSTTTLIDTSSVWEVDKWKDATVEITHVADGKHYYPTITSNTADTLNFAALAITVAAGDHYEIRLPITIADINDRAARLLGVIENLKPIEKASEHNVAKGADTAILASAVSPTNTPCLFRISVSIDAATVFKADITKGENTQTVEFNSGANLAANALYIFDMLVHSGDTVNWKCTGAVTYLVFRVQEIVAGVQ